MTKLSIILPSYNHAKFLKERLNSIVNQTFTDWELIIIDDCSTDESVLILEQFANKNKDKVKHFIKNETNLGSGYTSWNKGINLAETEYIWIAETDDYSDVNFLQEMVTILEDNKGLALVFCGSNYVDENKKWMYDSMNRTKDLEVSSGSFKIFDAAVFINRMPFNTYITNGSSVVFRMQKEVPEEIFNFKQSSDQFLWTNLIQNNRFGFLNKKLNYFRRHEKSTTEILSKKNSKQLYLEKIDYINYFKLKVDSVKFLKNYIKNVFWKNKSAFLDTTVIVRLKNVRFVKLKYYILVVQFFFIKAFKKLWI